MVLVRYVVSMNYRYQINIFNSFAIDDQGKMSLFVRNAGNGNKCWRELANRLLNNLDLNISDGLAE